MVIEKDAIGMQERKKSAVTTSTGKERFIPLEWLRFWLGFYIVIFHTLHHYGDVLPWAPYITNIGFFSTSTFFLLSGFLLAHVYLEARSGGGFEMRESSRSFLTKRISNLYPIHIGAILLTVMVLVVLPLLALTPEDVDNTSFRFVIYDTNNDTPAESLFHWLDNRELLLAAVMNLTMTHAWNPYYLTFNAPSWSISALFFFYLTFPLLGPWLRGLRRPLPALSLLNLIYLVPPVVVILTTSYGVPETGILHRNPLIRLPEFLAGIVLCALYHRRREAGLGLSSAMVGALMVLIVVEIVVASWLLTGGKGSAAYYLLHNGLMLPAQLALLFLCVQLPSTGSARWQRIASRLGGASLPMFALHVPLYLIFSRVEMVLAGEPSLCAVGEWRACFDAAGETSFAWYPLYLLLTVLFCVVFQEQFVVRVRQWLVAHLLPKQA